MKSACEWCKEHWKLIATIVIVAVAVVLITKPVQKPARQMPLIIALIPEKTSVIMTNVIPAIAITMNIIAKTNTGVTPTG